MFQDKSHDKVDDDRATESKKGQINKIHPHSGGSDSQFFTKPLAYTKSSCFEPSAYSVDHNHKDKKFSSSFEPIKALLHFV